MRKIDFAPIASLLDDAVRRSSFLAVLEFVDELFTVRYRVRPVKAVILYRLERDALDGHTRPHKSRAQDGVQ